MLFWYKVAKEGMEEYMREFEDHLVKQNKKSLVYMKHGLASFHGTDDFLGQLRDLGNDAVQRSTINRNVKDEQVMSITEVGNELRRALSMNLDDAEAVIAKLKNEIQALFKSATLCS